MKKILSSLFVLAFLLFTAQSASARALLSTDTTCTGADVTVTTTGETIVGTAVAQTPSGNSFLMRVRFNGIITTSANSTTYKLRVRRVNASGTALGDAIAETIKVTAGSVEAFHFEATDERAGSFASLTYVSTIEFAGADATGTVGWNCITVDYLQ